MLKLLSLLTSSLLLFRSLKVEAVVYNGVSGFPARAYDPICATACLRSLNTLTLNCSSSGYTLEMVTFATDAACFAEDTSFLESVAWCAHVQCAGQNITNSEMEYFWEQQITGQGDPLSQPEDDYKVNKFTGSAGVKTATAKWGYIESLSHVESPPTLQLTATDTSLNTTALASPDVYEKQYNVLYAVQRETINENKYGYV